MSTASMYVRLRRTRDTYANWIANDPVLYYGEIVTAYNINGDETDSRSKVGNGVHKFSELPWFSDPLKVNSSSKAQPNGIATLDAKGKIPLIQLPNPDDLVDGSKIIKSVPYQKTLPSYTGSPIIPVWNNYDSTKLVMTGSTSGTNVGDYTVLVKPVDGYKWADGTTDTKSVKWMIVRAAVPAIPTCTSTFSYTGSVQTPEFSNYDTNMLTLSGDTSATNAGEYTAVFTPKENYRWQDNTIGGKPVKWTISKVDSPLTISPTSMTINGTGSANARNISVNVANDSSIVGLSGNSNVATASANSSAKTVTVTPVAAGNCNVYVKATNTNYNFPNDVSCGVTVNRNLDKTNPVDVRTMLREGTAQSVMSIGDSINTPLNGTCFSFTASNLQTTSQLLGFNHNKSLESASIANRADFILGRSGSKDICLYIFANGYQETGFIMNPKGSTSYGTNVGGWKDSYMRNTTVIQILNLFPSNLKGIITSITKYTDNTGNVNNTSSAVTATTDKLFLLSEFELFGTRTEANQYEQSKQLQYQYYKNGNPKLRSGQRTNNYVVGDFDRQEWWLRSPNCSKVYSFCFVDSTNSPSSYMSACSEGVAPAFSIS